MDDATAVSVVDRRADRLEDPQPPFDRKPQLVASPGERSALDVLHREVGPSVLGRPRLVELGDAGVVERGEGLPLGLQPGEGGRGVEPPLHELQGDAAADRVAAARRGTRRPCRPRRGARAGRRVPARPGRTGSPRPSVGRGSFSEAEAPAGTCRARCPRPASGAFAGDAERRGGRPTPERPTRPRRASCLCLDAPSVGPGGAAATRAQASGGASATARRGASRSSSGVDVVSIGPESWQHRARGQARAEPARPTFSHEDVSHFGAGGPSSSDAGATPFGSPAGSRAYGFSRALSGSRLSCEDASRLGAARNPTRAQTARGDGPERRAPSHVVPLHRGAGRGHGDARQEAAHEPPAHRPPAGEVVPPHAHLADGGRVEVPHSVLRAHPDAALVHGQELALHLRRARLDRHEGHGAAVDLGAAGRASPGQEGGERHRGRARSRDAA